MNEFRKLKTHQHECRRLIRKLRGRAMVLMAPGTGKTLVGVRSAVTPTLVICRRDDFLTWKLELIDDGVEERLMFFVQTGTQYLTEVRDYDALPYGPIFETWFFVTYDLMKNPRVAEWVKRSPFRTVIADEGDAMAHWSSARTKACFKSTRHIPRRLLMTGTAIGNSYKDLFSQALFVDDGKTFGAKEYDFLQRYYLQAQMPYGGKGKETPTSHGWYLQKGAKDRIKEKLKQIAFAVDEDDVLKLPPERNLIKSVPMTSVQETFYEDALKYWEINQGDGNYMELTYVIQQLQKLKQIANGFYYDEEGVAQWITDHKYRMVLQYLKEDPVFKHKKKIVIWCSRTAEIQKYMELLSSGPFKAGALEFRGSLSKKQREKNRLDFKHDPSYKFFVGQVDAGRGMNELIVSDTAVYHSNSMRVRSKKQSKNRTRRYGSERHEFCYYVEAVTEGSIEVKLLRNINAGIQMAKYVIEGLKRGKTVRELLEAQ